MIGSVTSYVIRIKYFIYVSSLIDGGAGSGHDSAPQWRSDQEASAFLFGKFIVLCPGEYLNICGWMCFLVGRPKQRRPTSVYAHVSVVYVNAFCERPWEAQHNSISICDFCFINKNRSARTGLALSGWCWRLSRGRQLSGKFKVMRRKQWIVFGRALPFSGRTVVGAKAVRTQYVDRIAAHSRRKIASEESGYWDVYVQQCMP